MFVRSFRPGRTCVKVLSAGVYVVSELSRPSADSVCCQQREIGQGLVFLVQHGLQVGSIPLGRHAVGPARDEGEITVGGVPVSSSGRRPALFDPTLADGKRVADQYFAGVTGEPTLGTRTPSSLAGIGIGGGRYRGPGGGFLDGRKTEGHGEFRGLGLEFVGHASTLPAPHALVEPSMAVVVAGSDASHRGGTRG